MTAKRAAFFALACALIAFGWVVPALAEAPTGWTVDQLTTQESSHKWPRVYGDRVTWVDDTAGGQVWTWRAGGDAQQISDDSGINSPAEVSGDRVVWLGYLTGTGSRIRTWTPSSSVATVSFLPNGILSNENWPQISGDRVVWGTQALGQPRTQVYTWTPSSEVATVSENPYGVQMPVISGERVAWYGSNGPAYQIYTRMIGDDAPLRMTDTVTGVEYRPSVSGDRVVWEAQDDVGWWVRSWTAGSGVETLGPSVDMDAPTVSDGRVVWRAHDESGDAQIVTWKAGVTTTVTAGDGERFHPQVSGDRLVWESSDGVFGQICTWKLGDSAITTLTTDAHPHMAPRVWGDRVVWQGYDDNGLQIFTAAPQPTAPVIVPTALTKPTVSPRRPKHGSYATFSCYLAPGATRAAGARAWAYLYHRETKKVRKKIRRKWKTVKVSYWRLRKSVAMGSSLSGGCAKYSVRAKVPYKGSWLVTVKCSVPTGYSAPTAKSATFSAK